MILTRESLRIGESRVSYMLLTEQRKSTMPMSLLIGDRSELLSKRVRGTD